MGLIVHVLFSTLWSSVALADALPNGPHTMAHRGTMRLEDENTLEAIRVAHAHGVDIVEMDPRQTRDGVLVLMHDETVDRTTDGTGLLSQMNWRQVQALQTHRGHRVPTLSEALQLAATLNLFVYIDIKDMIDVSVVREQLLDAHMMERAWIGCYTRDEIVMFEQSDVRFQTIAAWPLAVRTLNQATDIGVSGVATLPALARKRMIRRAHKRGLLVVTMPLNKSIQLNRMHRRGLDILQSDDLDMLQAWRDENLQQ